MTVQGPSCPLQKENKKNSKSGKDSASGLSENRLDRIGSDRTKGTYNGTKITSPPSQSVSQSVHSKKKKKRGPPVFLINQPVHWITLPPPAPTLLLLLPVSEGRGSGRETASIFDTTNAPHLLSPWKRSYGGSRRGRASPEPPAHGALPVPQEQLVVRPERDPSYRHRAAYPALKSAPAPKERLNCCTVGKAKI